MNATSTGIKTGGFERAAPCYSNSHPSSAGRNGASAGYPGRIDGRKMHGRSWKSEVFLFRAPWLLCSVRSPCLTPYMAPGALSRCGNDQHGAIPALNARSHGIGIPVGGSRDTPPIRQINGHHSLRRLHKIPDEAAVTSGPLARSNLTLKTLRLPKKHKSRI
jgi:hypothetical protein